MSTLLSPGVYIAENDLSAISPNTSANVTFIATKFHNGPCDEPMMITNKNNYELIYGKPANDNFNGWFQGYKFFDYGDQLIVSRAYIDEYTVEATIDNPTTVYNFYTKPEDIIPVEDPLDPTTIIYYQMRITTPDSYDFKVRVGDVVTINSGTDLGTIMSIDIWDQTLSSPQSGYNMLGYDTYDNIMAKLGNINDMWVVNEDGHADDNIAYVWGDTVTTGTFTWEAQGDYVQPLQLRLTLKFSSDPSQVTTQALSGVIKLQTDYHRNGGTQAYARGILDNSTETIKPKFANATNPGFNVDVPVPTENGSTVITNPNRLNYIYDLIKNESDFDVLYTDNALQSFMQGIKLKFYTKYANEHQIEICIANPYDFLVIDDKNTNKAIAFTNRVGNTIEYIYLTSLFDYTPLDDEFAIAIKYGDDIETYVVSLDPESLDGNGRNNYIETVINDNSKYIKIVDNIATPADLETPMVSGHPASYLICDRFGWDTDSLGNDLIGTPAADGVASTVLVVQGGNDPTPDQGSLRDAYFQVEDKDLWEIDVVIADESEPNIAIELADARKDCIAYVGAKYEDTVGRKAEQATNNIVNYITRGNVTRTMFAAFFANYFKVYDKYNKKSRWINCAGDMAGIRCDTTSKNAPWWVSAGLKRGIIRNIERLAFTPSLPQRDSMYKNGINPIVQFPGTGNLVWGNKTLYPIASSFDRINVRTLFNTLERTMAKAARSQLFEFNDSYTRNAILSMFNPYLATIKAGRGITDYLVICDETNNTPDVISRNELHCDIYIKPAYAAEMILLVFNNVGTRSFSEVIGA